MLPETGIVPDVRRLAVLKAGGLGDVLFALPALEALRAAYPDAELTLLTSAVVAELLGGGRGPVDRTLVVPAFEGERASSEEGQAALDVFCARLRDERLDVAVQMHGGGANSNPLLLRLGARLTAGLRTADAPPLDRTVPYEYWRNEVLRCLEVAGLVGATPVSLEPRLVVTNVDIDASLAVLPADGRPLAVLHPGAGDPRRWWPAEKFAEVARGLSARGFRTAVIGAAGEARLAGRVTEGSEAVDLSGRLDIRALAGLLSRAAVVVSNDSGPLHLAAAVGAPTVGIYWCGNLITAGPLTSTRRRALASWRLRCPECGADCMAEGCTHRASFVADVPVADVLAAALELAGQQRATKGEQAS